MVKVGIVGYTPLNGHPYSFGWMLYQYLPAVPIQMLPFPKKQESIAGTVAGTPMSTHA